MTESTKTLEEQCKDREVVIALLTGQKEALEAQSKLYPDQQAYFQGVIDEAEDSIDELQEEVDHFKKHGTFE